MNTLDLLKKLITFRSVTADVAENNRCTDFLCRYLKKNRRGIYTKLYNIHGKKCLYACTRKTKKPDLLIVSHTDVVAGAADLFTPKMTGNWLYGRGASDCKVNAAVAAQTLCGKSLNRSVGALFSSDEETGGETTEAAAKDGIDGDIILVLDTGSFGIVTKQKGILNLSLQAHGRACHASTPWRGVNAIASLWEAYQRVEKIFPRTSEAEQWKNTIAPTLISGGQVINAVPDQAELSINIRFTERTDHRKLLARIRKAASPVKIKDYEVFHSFMTKRTDPRILNFKKAMEKLTGKEFPFGQLNGATDARHFTASKGAVIMSGIPGKGAHSVSECVNVAMMQKFEDALRKHLSE